MKTSNVTAYKLFPTVGKIAAERGYPSVIADGATADSFAEMLALHDCEGFLIHSTTGVPYIAVKNDEGTKKNLFASRIALGADCYLSCARMIEREVIWTHPERARTDFRGEPGSFMRFGAKLIDGSGRQVRSGPRRRKKTRPARRARTVSRPDDRLKGEVTEAIKAKLDTLTPARRRKALESLDLDLLMRLV